MFRTNAGSRVYLRDYAKQHARGRTSYDLHLGKDGLVHPIKGDVFAGPNGCSLRPHGYMQQEIVRNFDLPDTVIWQLKKGLKLPKNLVLYHEHTDHYSLQTRVPVTLDVLNTQLTDFFTRNCTAWTQKAWCDEFPFGYGS
ncbi:hypothetical protein JCM10207_004047 [Rhodosporidiobolus poonsookiae]